MWAKSKVVNDIPCPISSTALGSSFADAMVKAEIQNDIFAAWLKGIDGGEVLRGSVRWICGEYKKQDAFKKLAKKTRKDYSGLIDRLCLVKPKNIEFGNFQAIEIKPRHADKLYEIMREEYGQRYGSYAMQVARRLWGINFRLGHVKENPFEKMGLKSSPEKETRAWTRAECEQFIKTAKSMGLQSMAISARIAFELCVREADVIESFLWSNYCPGEQISYKQRKTKVEISIPLVDSEGALFPELEKDLTETARTGPLVVMRDNPDKKRKMILPYKADWFRQVFRKVREKAKLPSELKFMGLRHGGATELSDAGASEREIISTTGHKTAQMLIRYSKKTQTQVRNAARKRRALRVRSVNLSE